MSVNMVSVRIIAERWGLTTRRVGQLCNSGDIKGAIKVGGLWKIPEDAARPDVLRDRATGSYEEAARRLPCPVGVTSYKEVSSECYYVDKTLLIKDIIDSHNKVLLFTRPRRFGKTLAMDMLKTFFEKTPEDTSEYFENRKIWACADKYKAYQGAFPVVFLSLKDIKYETWTNALLALRMVIAEEFRRHGELGDSQKLSDYDRNLYGRIASDSAGEIDYQMSLKILTQLLYKHYDIAPVVIIDEYDTPVQQGYINGYYDEVVAFVRNMFSAGLKDNPALEFGVLTGVLRIAKESLFSGLNNLMVNTVLDHKYSEYFGFTEDEVKEMAAYYRQSRKLPEIREWYDGYRFGSTEVYNPWSVVCYFNNGCQPRAFWSRTGSNDFIIDYIRAEGSELRDSLMRLMQDEPVTAMVETDTVYSEIMSSDEATYSFLLVAGYLKIAEIVAVIDDSPVCKLLLPNKEIKGAFKKSILDNLAGTMPGSVISDFRLALNSGDSMGLQDALRRYLLQSASCYDTARESFYHGLVLGLLAVMCDEYVVSSNREAGEGRFDIQLRPRKAGNLPGILLEFKADKDADEQKLDVLADSAIEQIRNRNYGQQLRAEGVTQIYMYGISFSGKKAVVRVTEG